MEMKETHICPECGQKVIWTSKHPRSLKGGKKEPTLRLSKQMRRFLSFLDESYPRKKSLEDFRLWEIGKLEKVETLKEPNPSKHVRWGLQRMARRLFDRELVWRKRTNRGYEYYLSVKGQDLVRKRKLEI